MNELANRRTDGWMKIFVGRKLNFILAEWCRVLGCHECNKNQVFVSSKVYHIRKL